MQNQAKLNKFQEYIGYQFTDPSILQQALTTPQFGNEFNLPHYEILETLGDAVIKLIFSLKLYKVLEVKTPGRLTRIKQALESNQTFLQIATEMKLWKYIYASKNQNIQKSSILSDVFEAICGALYIDTGEDLTLVQTMIIERYFKDWNEIITNRSDLSKNELLEFLQKEFNITPSIKYQYLTKGAQHELRWIAKKPRILDQNGALLLKLPRDLKSSPNKSKKSAEKELSRIILEFLRNKNKSLATH